MKPSCYFVSFVSFVSFVLRLWAVLAVQLFVALPPAHAQSGPIGIVIMHGKGGGPQFLVADLARKLEAEGYLVANLEMPWSGKRNYDGPVAKGEEEVEAALAGLRGKGATKVFVAGHSQGGAFALHLAGKIAADGIVCIAPGGNVGNRFFSDNLGDALARARQLVADGKGAEPARLADYENARGTYAITSIPAAYVTWFDPNGAMNMDRAARAVNPRMPMLWIVPKRDYPGLIKSNLPMFRVLPAENKKLYEPDSDHRAAPTASADEIMRWTKEVAARGP